MRVAQRQGMVKVLYFFSCSSLQPERSSAYSLTQMYNLLCWDCCTNWI